MPKEYINYPVMTAFVHVIGDDSPEPDPIPAAPQVGLHWDGDAGVIQLSMDIDMDVLKRILAAKEADENAWDGSEVGRQIIFTEALTRADMQRLIKHARRARDSVYGADE